MTEEKIDFPDALREAQRHGYAEADPTLDVNGWDAAHKAAILASLAFGSIPSKFTSRELKKLHVPTFVSLKILVTA
jgi:homoserine dehydrogenase